MQELRPFIFYLHILKKIFQSIIPILNLDMKKAITFFRLPLVCGYEVVKLKIDSLTNRNLSNLTILSL